MSAPHPRAVSSLGPMIVARIEARREGDPLTPDRAKSLRWWQKLIIYRMYEVDADGLLCWKKVLISTARQVGKSVALREIALDRMAGADHYGEPQLVLHIAKDLSIADEIQRPARQWANTIGDPWHGVGGNGRWAVEFNGVMGRWLVRSQQSVYGYSASMTMVDEAWAIDPEHITEGVEPTMVEREQPMMLLVSTAHREATPLMPDLRNSARMALDMPEDDILLIEWSVSPTVPVEHHDHRAVHRMASPHWDDRRAAFIASKVEQIGFAEQWLNIWPDTAGAEVTLVKREVLQALAVPGLTVTPNTMARSYCIYPDLDQTAWHVVASGVDADENLMLHYMGLFRTRKLATEAVIAEARRGIPADLVVPRVLRGRIPKIPGVRTMVYASEADVAAATTTVRPLLTAGKVRYDGHGTLTDQMVGAVLEIYGETVRITSKGSPGPVEAAKAAALAGWWSSRQDRPTAVVV
jgi:hypothetical protein